ncbi:uncharacterized protein BDCG_08570 [Blastomyces dermatitidis ER-3]|uniref:Uncharacterized protein n=2 Tax=Ajellomyces dermatitidis TaxID=5039 RepID=F2T5E6_AJEDA|nr:uncharacterized protein BDCG_08570 [Blastomyces dermatitidis ER-3]EEQ85301.1 hypothetical protein BDCG_08570 [Blastomyces dermatitidis ER-3]EGE78371.1 hypothetical protein BDDG_01308 [Blastomyces dermatitidis ATCC 18188]
MTVIDNDSKSNRRQHSNLEGQKAALFPKAAQTREGMVEKKATSKQAFMIRGDTSKLPHFFSPQNNFVGSSPACTLAYMHVRAAAVGGNDVVKRKGNHVSSHAYEDGRQYKSPLFLKEVLG